MVIEKFYELKEQQFMPSVLYKSFTTAVDIAEDNKIIPQTTQLLLSVLQAQLRKPFKQQISVCVDITTLTSAQLTELFHC